MIEIVIKMLVQAITAIEGAVFDIVVWPILLAVYNVIKIVPYSNEVVKIIDIWFERISERWPPESPMRK